MKDFYCLKRKAEEKKIKSLAISDIMLFYVSPEHENFTTINATERNQQKDQSEAIQKQ